MTKKSSSKGGPLAKKSTSSSKATVTTEVAKGMPGNFLATYPYSGTAVPGRPVRSNRGIGGQRDQLEKASAIVGEGLLNKKTGQKRDRNNLNASTPENLCENDLAPPIPTKRARVSTSSKVIILISFVSEQYCFAKCFCDHLSQVPQQASRAPDETERRLPSIQAIPKPTLTFAEKGSPYGFPTATVSQALARPNQKALLNMTNAQVNTLANNNHEVIDLNS